MPFIHVNDESDYVDDEDDSEASAVKPPKEFEYERATGRFNSKALSPMSTTALDLLRIAGATEVRIRYDGGNDEGFGYFEAAVIDGVHRSAADVISILTADANVQAIRNTIPPKERDKNAYWRDETPAGMIGCALEELAEEVAAQLLGRGFGTGEYELYGAITINLKTSQASDDPNAPRPANSR